MTSRAVHYRNKARHDQREFATPKPKSVSQEESTKWMGEFISSIQGITTSFGADSMIALQLGGTTEDRVLKLRALSKLGVLHMSAYKVDGKFVEYRWELTAQGMLPQ